MNDVTVIDRFLDTFSRYIDSGFGLLQGEVAFLTATLIVIDMTIAGLFWAMGHATGQGEDASHGGLPSVAVKVHRLRRIRRTFAEEAPSHLAGTLRGRRLPRQL